jgi:tetratricopeptide (TPR) repeat protein
LLSLCLRVCFLLLSVLAAGCVMETYRDDAIESTEKAVELTTTPFYPQSRYQCGPASLATLLNTTGLDIDPDQLVKDVYLPQRKGSLQVEMTAAVRRYGRVPYQPGQDIESIIFQLKNDMPVLVLLNLGLKVLPAYHYAVVIGYDPAADVMILRSGMDYRLLMGRQQFHSAWHRSGSWALVVLEPGELPPAIDLERYLTSVIALESAGQWQSAELSYRAVLKQWPANVVARFGLANSLRRLGKLDQAVAQYRNVLKLDEEHKPARNNLADTLLHLGRCDDASATIEHVVIGNDLTSEIDRAIQKTRSEIISTCFQKGEDIVSQSQ